MRRARDAWLVSLGLLGAGWLIAHVLSYVLVVPDAAERRQMLMQTGHGYFRVADLLILCATVTLAGLAVCVVASKRRLPTPSPWTLALLPPAGFVVQEHAERLAVSGAFPSQLVAEPRFLLGLLLQLPFALAALLAAQFLLVAAGRLARLSAAAVPPTVVAWLPALLPAPALRTRPAALALGYSERGPPLPLRG